MIVILFSPGNFGSTVEYVLRAATEQYSLAEVEILADGSMHGFKKMHHLTDDHNIQKFFTNRGAFSESDIVSIVYPSQDNTQLSNIWAMIESSCRPLDKFIVIHAHSMEYEELRFLFTAGKIVPNTSIDYYYQGTDILSTVKNWDATYQTLADMKPWQLREWLSLLCFEPLALPWVQFDNRFLKVSTQELLENTLETFEKIIEWCGLVRNNMNLELFAKNWSQSQQYILDDYRLAMRLVDATIQNIHMTIPPDLSIWAQALIQRRLRTAGFELQCDGLDVFPGTTGDLHQLMYSNAKH